MWTLRSDSNSDLSSVCKKSKGLLDHFQRAARWRRWNLNGADHCWRYSRDSGWIKKEKELKDRHQPCHAVCIVTIFLASSTQSAFCFAKKHDRFPLVKRGDVIGGKRPSPKTKKNTTSWQYRGYHHFVTISTHTPLVLYLAFPSSNNMWPLTFRSIKYFSIYALGQIRHRNAIPTTVGWFWQCSRWNQVLAFSHYLNLHTINWLRLCPPLNFLSFGLNLQLVKSGFLR